MWGHCMSGVNNHAKRSWVVRFAENETGAVVRLGAYRKNRGDDHPMAQVDAYWHALYSRGNIPKRHDIDPRGIDTALAHAFVVERVARSVLRFRVAGHALCDFMGMELRGMPLSALFSSMCRPDLLSVVPAIFDRPALCRMELSTDRNFLQGPLTARMTMLPLRGHTGEITHALGAMEIATPKRRPGKTPRRFDRMTTHLQTVHARKTPSDQTAGAAFTPGFADPTASYATLSSQRLRLVETDS